MFYCGIILYNGFKHVDIKGVELRVTSAASIVRRQFPNSRFEHHIRILTEEY